MNHNILKWLSGSLILLVLLSCKKQKGILDDFNSGRFDFVCAWEKNGVKDTVTGEVSGPYSQSPYYYFRVKQELGGISSLKDFEVGSYSRMINETFRMKSQLNTNATFRLIGYKTITQFFVPGYNNLDAQSYQKSMTQIIY